MQLLYNRTVWPEHPKSLECHGSSHPSCNGIPYHAKGWYECRAAEEEAQRQAYQACVKDVKCYEDMLTRQQHVKIATFALIFLLFAMLILSIWELQKEMKSDD